jgi:hypothetical protein
MRAGSVLSALALAVLHAARADAQMLPGTNDDVGAALLLIPSVVPVPLEGFAVRGGTPDDTVILLDGFEIPRLQHFLALRSVIAADSLGDASLKTAPDVNVGRAPTALALTSETQAKHSVEVSTLDASARMAIANAGVNARFSLTEPFSDTRYGDLHARISRTRGAWNLLGSFLLSSDESTRDDVESSAYFYRATAGALYTRSRWRASFAVSTLDTVETAVRSDAAHYDASKRTFDTRAEVVRIIDRAAGLSYLEWRLGQQMTIAHHDLDVAWSTLPREGSPQPQHPAADDTSTRFSGRFWTPDAALWTSLAANLSTQIRATTGVRIDVFGRGTDVATQPRGELYISAWPQTRVAIAAGAYRRPPQQRDELFTEQLNPERTTQVTARVEHEHQALRVQGNVYYVDRTRLVIRDDLGVLRNTGTGASLGVEVSAQLKMLGWYVWGGASLSRSTRKDFPTGAERPAELDQPLRLDLLVTKRIRRWQLGGRVQLASGLPTTSIQETVFDADRDTYEPIFGRTYDERLPYRYEIDVRVDRTFKLGATARLAAFVDLRLSPSTLGYRDSFDYEQRAEITLPFVPYAGLRGSL